MGRGVGVRVAAVAGLLIAAGLALRPATTGSGSRSPAADATASLLLAVVFGALAAACVVGAVGNLRVLRRLPPGPAGTRRRTNVVGQILILALCAALLMTPSGSLLLHRLQDHLHPPQRTAATDARIGYSGAGDARHRAPVPQAAALGAGLVGLGVLILALRRRRPSARPIPGDPYELGRVVAAGVAALADSGAGDPRERVIRCYAAMEGVLAAAGTAPRPADTPAELLARAQASGAVPAGPATALTELFRLARFGRGPVTAGDLDDARAYLAELRAALRQPATSGVADGRAG